MYKDSVNRLYFVLQYQTAIINQTRLCHWNVVGPAFGPLHKLFGKQYEELSDLSDQVAERIRAIGEMVPDSAFMLASLSPKDAPPSGAMKMVNNLAQHHKTIIDYITESLSILKKAKDTDEGTINFLTGVMEQHQKMHWMLVAHNGTEQKQ